MGIEIPVLEFEQTGNESLRNGVARWHAPLPIWGNIGREQISVPIQQHGAERVMEKRIHRRPFGPCDQEHQKEQYPAKAFQTGEDLDLGHHFTSDTYPSPFTTSTQRPTDLALIVLSYMASQ